MAQVIPATPEEAGCWIDSRWGSYARERLITIARCRGWQPSQELETDLIIVKFCDDFPRDLAEECAERVEQAIDDIVAWMNNNVAPENYEFKWVGYEFFLMNKEEITLPMPV